MNQAHTKTEETAKGSPRAAKMGFSNKSSRDNRTSVLTHVATLVNLLTILRWYLLCKSFGVLFGF